MKKNILITLLLVVIVSLLFVKQKNAPITTQDTPTTPSVQEEPELQKASEVRTGKNSVFLSNKGLEKLPAEVLANTSIEELDISFNNLTGALPAEIRHLKNLRVLIAGNNKMTGVPAEMGQLSSLEFLDLSNNDLTGLPNELGNLKNLKTLNLSGNNYSEQDLEVIKRGLPSSTQIIL